MSAPNDTTPPLTGDRDDRLTVARQKYLAALLAGDRLTARTWNNVYFTIIREQKADAKNPRSG
jgi:hypothetical protein